MARALTVMTQNVLGGGSLWKLRSRALARRIAHERPDVIGLQEVHAASRSAARTQAHEIADLVGGYHVDFAPGRVAQDGACEGCALLCRREIRERSVLSLTFDPLDRLDRAGQRVVLAATLDVAEHTIDVFVTHLSLSKRARVRTMQELVAFTAVERAASGSVAGVLLGDLNATPGEEAIAAVREAWTDAWGARRRGATWPAPLPYLRIDYVLVQPSDRWVVRECRRVRSIASDHLGVLAHLVLA